MKGPLGHLFPQGPIFSSHDITAHSDERISYNGHERISEYIRMPHYVPNEYPNIFGCNIFTERISKFICIPETAQIQIQILFEDNFIRIF